MSNTAVCFVAVVMPYASLSKCIHYTVWRRDFRGVEGGGEVLCSTGALNNLVAGLDVSYYIS